MGISLIEQQLTQLAQSFLAWIPSLVAGLLIFIAFYFVGKGIERAVVQLAQERRRQGNVALALGRLAQIVVVLVGLLVALSVVLPTFSPGEAVQLLGITSVAVGFGFRDILQNFLAGILLLLTEPFRIGDQIIVGAYEGTVETVETRATMLRTYDGRRVVIPNADLFTQSVTVNTAFDRLRLEVDVTVGYGDDLDGAKAVMLAALAGLRNVLAEPAPEALVIGLVDSGVAIRVRWWISPPRRADVFRARDEVLTALRNRLTAEGIDIAYPTRTILFHDQSEATDGDRARQREGWPAGRGPVPGPRIFSAPALPRRDGAPPPPPR